MELKQHFRLIPRLSRRGFLLLGCSSFIPLFSIFIEFPFYLALALTLLIPTAMILLLLIDFNKTKVLLSYISTEVKLAERLYAGIPSNIVIAVTFKGNLSGDIFLILRLPHPFGVLADTDSFTLELNPVSHFFSKSMQITPLYRGLLNWDYIWVRILSPSRLFFFQKQLPLNKTSSTKVYPNPFSHKSSALRQVSPSLIGYKPFDFTGGEGREFDRLRRYTTGDDLRRVDWKRSAKTHSLLVKAYRPESHQRVNFLLDCSRRMGILDHRRTHLDFASDAIAHLLQVTTEGEDEVGLLAFNHKVLAQIPCRRGRLQRKLIMESLVDVSLGSFEADYELVRKFGELERRRSLLILITSISNPVSLETLAKCLRPLLQRHLIVVVAVYDRELHQLAEQPARDESDAFIIGSAREHLETISRRIQSLKKSGISCIYSDVLSLSEKLREKYIELKYSGRW